ncbi:CatB-related O-acetyltransferase [uncultured Bacteroides sp.]|uniref:xenobiotic acyltransferase family protein n=1 Tax=uncultured Bacteroides sp. TaxID=162156 RepID=UPI0025F1793D|nr:CatB-related O-acetyltransferase [uncultured Bacteroides sp.]
MNDIFIHDSAKVESCRFSEGCRVYKDVHLKKCVLDESVSVGDFSRVQETNLGRNVSIQRGAQIFNSQIGDYTYTGRNFTMWHAEVGKFCSVSWNVSIGGANHDYNRITSHAFLYSDMFDVNGGHCGYDRFQDKCIIGNDVWIAADAIICRNVTIGDGAVIAAGAVVTKNVTPYSIVGGVPAKHLKYRFSKDIILELKDIKWWELPHQIIKNNFELFNSHPTKEILKQLRILKNSCK